MKFLLLIIFLNMPSLSLTLVTFGYLTDSMIQPFMSVLLICSPVHLPLCWHRLNSRCIRADLHFSTVSQAFVKTFNLLFVEGQFTFLNVTKSVTLFLCWCGLKDSTSLSVYFHAFCSIFSSSCCFHS